MNLMRIFLWIYLMLWVSNSGIAQTTSWRVQGLVIDHEKKPVEACLLFITKDSSGVPLQFIQSDQSGRFVLQPSDTGPLWLNARTLGFEPYKRLLLPSDSIGLVIQLAQTPYDLKEVVINEKAPAIVEKSDTLRYNLKYFRDSSEYNVEDLLRKLPGIQINGDGGITVQGKPLTKVLVEGEDVFGAKYTIGTRNIRALTIDVVEVIDHHQDNPVLKGVKHSEDIVLNLKFSKNVKQSMGGTAELGLGAGHEAKYELHSNLFSLANKSKYYWINSLGNTGSQYSPQELDASYGNSDSDYKLASPFENVYLSPMNIDNPGLSAPFVNNSITNFSTLRSIFNWSETWKVKINATFSNLKDKQYSEDNQAFLLDAGVYELRTAQQRRIRFLSAEGEVQLIHTNRSATRSFVSNATWNTSNNQGFQAITQFLSPKNMNLNTEQQVSQGELSLSAIFSQKIQKNSVSQIQFNYFNGSSRQHLIGQNETFAILWGLDSTLLHFAQNLQTPYQEGTAFFRQIWAWNHLNLEAETKATIGQSALNVQIDLFNEPKGSVSQAIAEPPSKVGQQSWQQSIKLHGLIGKKNDYSLHSQLGTQRFNSDDRFSMVYGKIYTQLRHHFADAGYASLDYQYAQMPLAPQALLQSFYLVDVYNLVNQNPRRFSEKGHKVTFHYSRRNTQSFLFHHIMLRADFDYQNWQDSLYFFRSTQIAQPYFTNNNHKFWSSFRLEKFTPRLKLNAKVGLMSSWSKQFIGVDDSSIPLLSQTLKGTIDLSKSLENNLKIDINQVFEFNRSYAKASKWGENHFFRWQVSFNPFWQTKQWMIAFRFDRSHYIINDDNKINLNSTSLKIRRNFVLNGKKRSALALDIYNLQNIRQFKTAYKSDYFLYSTIVEAIPAFAVLKFDLTL